MTQKKTRKQAEILPLRTAAGGYRKGAETRSRILAVALEVFGAQGFDAATTRQIAEQAGTNLPALTYYFGNKQGLYLACAHEIVARYRTGVGAVAGVAAEALSGLATPADARLLLKRLFAALAQFLLSAGGAANQTAFVQREIASPGPAFEIMYAELWQPGIELAAELIARAADEKLSESEARVRAVMMISSLTGFLSGQRVIERALGDMGAFEMVTATLGQQIDDLGR